MADEAMRKAERAAATGGPIEAEALAMESRRAGRDPRGEPVEMTVAQVPFCSRCGRPAATVEVDVPVLVPVFVDAAGAMRYRGYGAAGAAWPSEVADLDGNPLLSEGDAGVLDVDPYSYGVKAPAATDEVTGTRTLACEGGHRWESLISEGLGFRPWPNDDAPGEADDDGLPF